MRTTRILTLVLASGLTISPLLYSQTAPGIATPEGDPSRGKAIFESSKANCLSCHRVNGWEFKMNDITWAGVLSTAGDVVFSGGREGYFFALDGRNGNLLWKVPLGGQVNSGPMSYAVNGRQYIAVAAGTSLFTFALRQ